MRRVIVESPYAGDVPANVAYARRCLADCLARGETPLASHLLLTQDGVLDDDVPGERKLGIAAGLAWYDVAHACVVYVDRGVSAGMIEGMKFASDTGVRIDIRKIGDEPRKPSAFVEALKRVFG